MRGLPEISPGIDDEVVAALHHAREADYAEGVIDCLVRLGGAHVDLQKLATARGIANYALSLSCTIGDSRRTVTALELLAKIDRDEGAHAEAVGRLLEAMDRCPAEPPLGLRLALAEAYQACNHLDAARDELLTARAQAAAGGDPAHVVEVDLQLSRVERRRRRPQSSASRLAAALDLAVDQGRPDVEIRCRVSAARACMRRNEHAAAVSHIERCETLLDHVDGYAEIIDTALMYTALGRLGNAARVIARVTDLDGQPTRLVEGYNTVHRQIAYATIAMEIDIRSPIQAPNPVTRHDG